MYKKVDSSCFKGWITLTKDFLKKNPIIENLSLGKGKDLKINFNKKKYFCKLRYVKRIKYPAVYQIRFDSNKELKTKFAEEFIQSYVILQSEREKHNNKEGQFRSKLKAGNQEVLIIKTINSNTLEFKPFIQIQNEWNALFRRLAKENAFEWVFSNDKDKKYLIQQSSKWLDKKELKKTEHNTKMNVIYYLLNSKEKTLYIGKATSLGKRVKEKRAEIPNWDKFRYDVLRPEFSNILERVEGHTIRAFASVLNNTQNFDSLSISNCKLVNKNWKKL